MSSDYRVVYVDAPGDIDRLQIATRIEQECDHASAEGWLLDHTIEDVSAGTTRGVWLVFLADVDADVAAVAVAEEILEQTSGGSQPRLD